MAEHWEENEPDMDMPPEAVAYNKGWDEGSKQSRSEVLAACVAYLKMAGEESIFTQHKQAYKNAAEVVAKLQPAASALKELLREERIKELDRFCDNAPEYSQEIIEFIEKRYKELGAAPYNKEKARAEGKG